MILAFMTARIALLVFVTSLACAGLQPSPESTVRQYLQAGQADDFDTVRSLVEEKCWDEPVGKAAAVHLLDIALEVEEMRVKPEEETETTAVVSYYVRGKVDATDAKTKTTLFGVEVEIEAAAVKVDDLENSGSFTLKKHSDGWKITCTPGENIFDTLFGN